MSCKCNEIGDYSGCYQHGDGSKWAEDQLAAMQERIKTLEGK